MVFHKFGKTEFLNLGFCSIFFKFWHSVSFVKDYRHTIYQYFLVKSDLCSLRPFRLHSFEKDDQNNGNTYILFLLLCSFNLFLVFTLQLPLLGFDNFVLNLQDNKF